MAAASSRRLPRLVTIPFSHYCERARWALDAAGIAYEEEPSAPIVHMINVYLSAGTGKEDRASSSLSTPALVLASGEVLRDSADIMRWADKSAAKPLYPADRLEKIEAIEQRLHDKLGTRARVLAYWSIRKPELFISSTAAVLPPSQRAVGSLVMSAIKPLIFGSLKITEARAERSLAALLVEFEWLSGLLEDSKYLAGDQLTGADVSLAALAAPALMVTRAEGNAAVPNYPGIAELEPKWAEAVNKLRSTKAGKHVLRLYRERPELCRVRIVDRPSIVIGAGAVVASLVALIIWGIVTMSRASNL